MVKLNKRGGLPMYLFMIFIIFTIVITTAITIDRKATSIKRQNIHNAVVAANLSSYYAIEMGEKEKCLSISPAELQDYLRNPDKIIESGRNLEEVVNIINSEYLPIGERYKSIYITKDKAYDYFSKYLQINLDLKETSQYNFVPNNTNNKAGIHSLKINEFDVYNAIYEDMNKATIDTISKEENRKYTGIHIDLNAKVEHTISYKQISGLMNVPIHIDTEITVFRPKIDID